MRATVIKADLLDAVQCVDHGGGTEKHGDVVLLRHNGPALELSTACRYGAYITTFQAIVDASQSTGAAPAVPVSLYSLRKAIDRIVKAKGQEVTVEDDGPILHLRCGNADATTEVVYRPGEDCYALEMGGGMASVLSRGDLQPALDMLVALKPREHDGCVYAQSLAISAGVAYATDALNLHSVKLRTDCGGFVSRAAAERLRGAKKWCDMKLWLWRDGDVQCGSADLDNAGVRCMMSWTTRRLCDTERDPLERLIGSMKRLLDGLATAPSWLCDGAALRQALRECEAFCTRGQAVLFLPCEEGARLLRYDVPDIATYDAKVDSADACTTMCEAVWPFPSCIALSGKRLAKIIGKADEVVIRVKDGVAAVEVTGDPVSRVMCEAVCPFEDRTDIF